MVDEALPFVSIIMPVRNEADFLGRAIRSILENDYPANRMEILVVDGMSDDSTREIVREMAREDARIRLFDNPNKIVPTAMNIGLRVCRGDIFIRVDGHVEICRDFISESIRCLAEHDDAWVVGGYIDTVSDTFLGRAISAAMKSPIGVGNSRFRLGGYEGWVDTLSFGAHHKWVLDKVGYFDEQLVRNQDDEFNMRVILAGGKIWLSSSICSTYYSRSSFKKLWRQYFQYGFWRIRTLQKHGRPATLRQIVPLLFVSSLVVLGLSGFVSQIFWWMLVGELGIYALGLVYGSIHVGKQAGWKYFILAPAVFAILHFAYGIGCLWGIIRFSLIRGWKMKRPDEFKLSR